MMSKPIYNILMLKHVREVLDFIGIEAAGIDLENKLAGLEKVALQEDYSLNPYKTLAHKMVEIYTNRYGVKLWFEEYQGEKGEYKVWLRCGLGTLIEQISYRDTFESAYFHILQGFTLNGVDFYYKRNAPPPRWDTVDRPEYNWGFKTSKTHI